MDLLSGGRCFAVTSELGKQLSLGIRKDFKGVSGGTGTVRFRFGDRFVEVSELIPVVHKTIRRRDVNGRFPSVGGSRHTVHIKEISPNHHVRFHRVGEDRA